MQLHPQKAPSPVLGKCVYLVQRMQWTLHRPQVLGPAHIFEFRLESWHRCGHDHVLRVRGRVPGHVDPSQMHCCLVA